MLITRNEDGRIAPATSRINLYENLLSNMDTGLGLVAARVLAMPVTSCAAELITNKLLGPFGVKCTLKHLGLQRAENLIDVKALSIVLQTFLRSCRRLA